MSEASPLVHLPTRRCDVVMKGGVTSGVVYPRAVSALAQDFRFHRIGGTSAGAIAAAFTAAAEYRRRGGDSSGFALLEELPDRLAERCGGRSRLLGLFMPDAATRPLFRVILAAACRGRIAGRIARTVVAILRGFPLAAFIGALPGAVLVALATAQGRGDAFPVVGLMGCGFGLAGALIGAAAGCLLAFFQRLPANLFGLCSGLTGDARRSPALTTWIADTLDRIAGKSAPGSPLTFGDLAGVDGDPIHLEMVTTCLTHGRPYRLPIVDECFFYDPAELRRLFPARIVRYMEEHDRVPQSDKQAAEWRSFLPMRPLPEVAHLPVVVAVRLSLSFPLLLSAVPLHAVDRSRRRQRRPDGRREPPRLERCWFSDGGICSNFPEHSFAQPLPRHPTFGINLRPFHLDYGRSADESRNVWMPRTNRAGVAAFWNRLDRSGRRGSLLSFGSAVISTMQGWSDNTQLSVPGYRDRVVHVGHAEDEGGLNLDMDAAAIARLAERGRCAGELLLQRFAGTRADGAGLDWSNHRWVRLRSTMALLEKAFLELEEAFNAPSSAGAPSYWQLLARAQDAPPPSYRFRRQSQKEFALQAVASLLDLARAWRESGESFADGAPRPEPELVIRPRM